MNEPGTISNTHFLVSRQVPPVSGSSLFGDVYVWELQLDLHTGFVRSDFAMIVLAYEYKPQSATNIQHNFGNSGETS